MLPAEDHDVMVRAERLYEERFKDRLEKTNMNAFVVIVPDSGDYFIGDTISEAAAAARAAHPGRPGHIIRVGHPTAVHIGATFKRHRR
jgi:hypothetical protein